MHLLTGSILVSTSLLDDSIFEQSIICITEKNKQGAIGFVVNKLFPKTLNQLEEFKHSLPFPLYNGGPVETGSLFFMHQRPDLIEGGMPIINGLYIGGDFKQAVNHINRNNMHVQEVKLFIGYCGWDAGELEQEVAEGCWEVKEAGFESIFSL